MFEFANVQFVHTARRFYDAHTNTKTHTLKSQRTQHTAQHMHSPSLTRNHFSVGVLSESDGLEEVRPLEQAAAVHSAGQPIAPKRAAGIVLGAARMKHTAHPHDHTSPITIHANQSKAEVATAQATNVRVVFPVAHKHLRAVAEQKHAHAFALHFDAAHPSQPAKVQPFFVLFAAFAHHKLVRAPFTGQMVLCSLV